MGIKFSQLADGSLSSCGVTNIILTDIEVGTTVCDVDLSWVIDCYGLRARKDQVLRNLDAEASHTDEEDFHLDELAHHFETVGSDLP